MPELSLQERFAPTGRCFGCGPANEEGLRIRSFEADDGTANVEFQPRREHEAFAGFVSGGILGTLIDCHSNWTAIAALIERSGASVAPSTVTAEYTVHFRRPTPSDRPLRVTGKVVEIGDDRATVESTIESGGIVTTTGRATFVVVGPNHPAYGRWGPPSRD